MDSLNIVWHSTCYWSVPAAGEHLGKEGAIGEFFCLAEEAGTTHWTHGCHIHESADYLPVWHSSECTHKNMNVVMASMSTTPV